MTGGCSAAPLSAAVIFFPGNTEPQIDGYEPVCPFDYLHLKTVDGNFEVAAKDNVTHREVEENTRHQKLLRHRNHLVEVKRKAIEAPPITIVREGESFVEFTIQNSTWFASRLSSDGDDGIRIDHPIHVFTTFSTDEFGSERCVASEDLLPVNVASSETMKAHCSNMGSIAVVRAYVRFDNADIKASGIEVPECCYDPYANSSLGSATKVIGYIFKLKCSTTCDNPNEYINRTTNGSASPPTTSLTEASQSTSAAHLHESPNTLPTTPSSVPPEMDLAIPSSVQTAYPLTINSSESLLKASILPSYRGQNDPPPPPLTLRDAPRDLVYAWVAVLNVNHPSLPRHSRGWLALRNLLHRGNLLGAARSTGLPEGLEVIPLRWVGADFCIVLMILVFPMLMLPMICL